MLKIWILPLALVCGSVAAEEVVVSGRVESVTLIPANTPSCPVATTTEHSDRRVVVSNTCGCQEVKIRVVHVYSGAKEGESLTLTAPLGEWCKPSVPINTAEPILIKSDGGALRWSALSDKSEK